jgi:hypothetical protein
MGVEIDVIAPGFIFQEFLAHEEHRNASRHQEDPRGDTRTASGVPGTRIRRISQ